MFGQPAGAGGVGEDIDQQVKCVAVALQRNRALTIAPWEAARLWNISLSAGHWAKNRSK